MEDYYNELYSEIEERDGLVVERTSTYWNNQYVDEDINVTVRYRASHFKNRKEMYKRIFDDIEKIKESLLEAQKSIEREEEQNGRNKKHWKRQKD